MSSILIKMEEKTTGLNHSHPIKSLKKKFRGLLKEGNSKSSCFKISPVKTSEQLLNETFLKLHDSGMKAEQEALQVYIFIDCEHQLNNILMKYSYNKCCWLCEGRLPAVLEQTWRPLNLCSESDAMLSRTFLITCFHSKKKTVPRVITE